MGRESRFALIHGLSLTSACAGEIEDKKLARRKDDKELRRLEAQSRAEAAERSFRSRGERDRVREGLFQGRRPLGAAPSAHGPRGRRAPAPAGPTAIDKALVTTPHSANLTVAVNALAAGADRVRLHQGDWEKGRSRTRLPYWE